MSSKMISFSDETKNKLVMGLSVLGILISVFIDLVIESEKGSDAPLCKISGTIFNCGDVVNSQYGTIFGIHVSLIGAFYFLVLLAIYLVELQDDYINAFMSLTGLGSIIYFIFIELVVLNAFCLYCTIVHIIVILIFLLIGPKSIKNSYKTIKVRFQK